MKIKFHFLLFQSSFKKTEAVQDQVERKVWPRGNSTQYSGVFQCSVDDFDVAMVLRVTLEMRGSGGTIVRNNSEGRQTRNVLTSS